MRCFEDTLYHATARENVASILTGGLKPTYLGSIVCASPTPEAAANFGEVVLRLDVTGYVLSCFDDCEDWERFIWTNAPIPPERLRVIP